MVHLKLVRLNFDLNLSDTLLLEVCHIGSVWLSNGLKTVHWRGTRCLSKFGGRGSLWPGIFCRGNFLFPFPSLLYFQSKTFPHSLKSCITEVTFWMRITVARISLLKTIPVVSRASSWICTLDFQESSWSFFLTEQRHWHLILRSLNLLSTCWVSLHSNPR